MRKLLTTVICFLIATYWLSAQSPNTDLQPVKTKEVTVSYRVCYHNIFNGRIYWGCDDRVPNLDLLLSLINFGSTLEFYVDGRKFNVQERLAFEERLSYQKKNVFPRNFFTLGTSAAYSYDSKYVYKSTQVF